MNTVHGMHSKDNVGLLDFSKRRLPLLWYSPLSYGKKRQGEMTNETKTPPIDISGKNSGRMGRMENLKPWKPGQSGNPKGCPPKAVRLSAILEAHLNDIADKDAKKRPWKELFVEAVVKMAIKGNGTVIREIFDRIDGKIPLPLRHGGDKSEPLLGRYMTREHVRRIGQAVLDAAERWEDTDPTSTV